MASAQHPVRSPGRDQKGDSLVAIKEWLIRDPGSPQPELHSGALPDTLEFHSAPLPEAIDPPAAQEELDESPSIAVAPEVPINSLLGERAEAAMIAGAVVAKEFFETRAGHDNEVQKDKEAPKAKGSVRRLLLRALACAVLLAAAAGFTYALLSQEEQKNISGAWQRLKDWSSYEFSATSPQKDLATVSQGSEAATRGTLRSEALGQVKPVKPAEVGTADDKPASAETRHGLEQITEKFGRPQRIIYEAWSRLKDWSAHQWEVALPKSDVGLAPDRPGANVRSATPSATSGNVGVGAAQPVPNTENFALMELQHRMNAMAEDLSALQQDVARLFAKQEQMTTEITALQSAQQTVIQKLSASRRNFHHRRGSPPATDAEFR